MGATGGGGNDHVPQHGCGGPTVGIREDREVIGHSFRSSFASI